MSSALEGGFLTTGSQGKSPWSLFSLLLPCFLVQLLRLVLLARDGTLPYAADELYPRIRLFAQRWVDRKSQWVENFRLGKVFPEGLEKESSGRVTSECLRYLKEFLELLMRGYI